MVCCSMQLLMFNFKYRLLLIGFDNMLANNTPLCPSRHTFYYLIRYLLNRVAFVALAPQLEWYIHVVAGEFKFYRRLKTLIKFSFC